MTASRFQALCLTLYFWPLDLVRAWKYGPKARHRLQTPGVYTWVPVNETQGYFLKGLPESYLLEEAT